MPASRGRVTAFTELKGFRKSYIFSPLGVYRIIIGTHSSVSGAFVKLQISPDARISLKSLNAQACHVRPLQSARHFQVLCFPIAHTVGARTPNKFAISGFVKFPSDTIFLMRFTLLLLSFALEV